MANNGYDSNGVSNVNVAARNSANSNIQNMNTMIQRQGQARDQGRVPYVHNGVWYPGTPTNVPGQDEGRVPYVYNGVWYPGTRNNLPGQDEGRVPYVYNGVWYPGTPNNVLGRHQDGVPYVYNRVWFPGTPNNVCNVQTNYTYPNPPPAMDMYTSGYTYPNPPHAVDMNINAYRLGDYYFSQPGTPYAGYYHENAVIYINSNHYYHPSANSFEPGTPYAGYYHENAVNYINSNHYYHPSANSFDQLQQQPQLQLQPRPRSQPQPQRLFNGGSRGSFGRNSNGRYSNTLQAGRGRGRGRGRGLRDDNNKASSISPGINQTRNKMEGLSENKDKIQEEHDNDGKVVPHLSKNRDGIQKSAPSHTENDDLIEGLRNDIVLGEVITRLPWYQRPTLTRVNRSWAHALTHSFPAYARLHNPRILSKFMVLFRTPRRKIPSKPNEHVALWLFSCTQREIRTLRVPAIPLHLQQHVSFVCDDNEECIYCFTRNFEKGVYDVEVLDLREATCRPWKRLPSLPISIDNCEYYAYRCSSTSTSTSTCTSTSSVIGSVTYTIYLTKTVETFVDDEPCAFSEWACTLTNSENDITCEDNWQCQGFSSTRPSHFSAQHQERPPLYVEMQKLPKSPLSRRRQRCLYRRCEKLDDSEPPYWHWGMGYILMFQEGRVGDQPAYGFYEICNRGFDVELLKMTGVRYGSGRIVDDEEGAPFWNTWQLWIDESIPMEEGEEKSAIRVSYTDMVSAGRVRGGGKDINAHVALRSHSLCLYRLVFL